LLRELIFWYDVRGLNPSGTKKMKLLCMSVGGAVDECPLNVYGELRSMEKKWRV
jgi:hypothetical protein